MVNIDGGDGADKQDQELMGAGQDIALLYRESGLRAVLGLLIEKPN